MNSLLSPLDPEKPEAERLSIPDGELLWLPGFISPADSQLTFQALREQTPWRQDHIRMHGRMLAVPRLQAWYGGPEARYGYSGLLLDPLPFTPLLESLRDRVEQAAGGRFNSVLLNYYRDGRDSVSWHSDDEKELGPEPLIASLSFGISRRFELRHKQRRGLAKLQLELGDGDLLVMGRGVQAHWQHQVPKQPRCLGERLNLTFRLTGVNP